ncbi:hypothetical protein [Cohnella sp. AR92]|uniref:hypothetical protein n=1 Tax=Cohnella sp. AR92 TaxID=648716 RepID=UPI000F8F55F3|nr:hypothetical protein [Cohnella sp. AR92]RUS45434.1 hypothetical protein ELR57_18910 [Cohnella sp. AR92]
MITYFIFALGCLFALLALLLNSDERGQDFLLSFVVFAVLYCVNRVNNALGVWENFNRTPINVMVSLSVIAYVIYLFRKRDDRWN